MEEPVEERGDGGDRALGSRRSASVSARTANLLGEYIPLVDGTRWPDKEEMCTTWPSSARRRMSATASRVQMLRARTLSSRISRQSLA
jgi:hypothetical protein